MKKGQKLGKWPHNSKDLKGQRFGRWLVIKCVSIPGGDNREGRRWLCLCDCGIQGVVRAVGLVKGSSKSCGCYRADRSVEARTLPNGEASFRRVYGIIKDGAKKRRLKWSLNPNEVRILTSGTCYYCGAFPENEKFSGKVGSYKWNGLDRLDSKEGYEIGNVVPCCFQCNFMKNTQTEEEFICRCWRIVERFKHIEMNNLKKAR